MPDTVRSGAAGTRRRYPRYNVIESQLLTADLVPMQAQQAACRGIVINLGEGGMAIQPFSAISEGTHATVRLALPGTQEPFSGTGMVAWVNSGGRAGICFRDASPQARAALRHWLSSPEAAMCAAQETAPPPAALASSDPASENEQIDFRGALQLLAERVRDVAEASGAAIALGNSSGMVCLASAGGAPDVGVFVRPDGSLSGQCLRTRTLVDCADMEAHPEVDKAAARRLGARSMAVVPVIVGEALAGILEVFSPQVRAFQEHHFARLERFAQLLAGMVDYQEDREAYAAGEGAAPEAPTSAENWLIRTLGVDGAKTK